MNHSHLLQGLVGCADIQSLADLAGPHDVLQDVRTSPFDLKTITDLALVVVLPFLPLVLTIIPFANVVDGVLKKLL